MRILSVFAGNHDSSATILNDGEIELHLPVERITRKKHDWNLGEVLEYLHRANNIVFDVILVNLLYPEDWECKEHLIELFNSEFECKDIKFSYYEHHLYHVYCGFYYSPFNEALCFVLDGHGCLSRDKSLGEETESVYLINDKTITKLSKRYKFEYESVGYRFETLSKKLGFDWYGAGKVMGLAQYKGYESQIDKKWLNHVDECYSLQKETEDEVIDLIRNHSEETGIKDIILTGGYALNCVTNYKLTKIFPHLNFFVDPICSDMGISLGQAYEYYKGVKRPENVYIGSQSNYKDVGQLKRTTYDEVGQLLAEGNVIAIFQGRSEMGYRALGNRSILLDPRMPNGRDYLNSIKGRENFRPFAGTVLKEHASEWFDIEESQYMQYAVKVKKDGIPAMIHVDNTCRVQTLTKSQNYHYYNLINSFYKKTGIPMVLNTSLNCAGESIAESVQHAIDSITEMKIKYLFLPEKMSFVS